MNELKILGVVQLIVVPVLFVLALGISVTKEGRPLNIVDYSRVENPARLHGWVGRRTLILPLVFLLGGIGSLLYPAYALPLLFLSTIAVAAVAAWLTIGSRRFYQ